MGKSRVTKKKRSAKAAFKYAIQKPRLHQEMIARKDKLLESVARAKELKEKLGMEVETSEADQAKIEVLAAKHKAKVKARNARKAKKRGKKSKKGSRFASSNK